MTAALLVKLKSRSILMESQEKKNLNLIS